MDLLPHKPSKKLKTYVEKVSVNTKRKIETSSISRNNPSRNLLIMMKLTNYGQKVNPGKELVVIAWKRLTTVIPKAREFNL